MHVNWAKARSFIARSLLHRAHAPSRARKPRSAQTLAVATTLLVGAALLDRSLRIEPGNPAFYSATLILALVYLVGSRLSGPIPRNARGRSRSRDAWRGLFFGAALLLVFLIGALVVVRIPPLRNPVMGLLDHAQQGSFFAVFLLTAVNGIAEEVYYRGALFAVIPQRYAVAVTAVLYAAVTAISGIALLALAALMLGVLAGLLRRSTGGVLAPITAHLTWSLGMLVLLPPAFSAFG